MADVITGEHVLRRIWSEADQAIKTVPAASTTFAVDLSHADGDSVYDVPMSASVNQAAGAVDCSTMREACLYGAGTVEVSPDGTNWYAVMMTALTPISICAAQIRITGTGSVYIRG